MANFMGPMAPPQAAPPQPAQLDVRTNPSQRAQFKTFMQGMQPQPTTAPIAPMLPAPIPSPMDQIDIFAPAPMASGGVVGGLNDLQKMSGQMVDALNTVVYGGGQGGGFGDSVSAGGGFGGGNMPPPLPAITQRLNGLTDQGPMNNPNSRLGPSIGLPFAQPLRMSVEDAYSQAQADARRQREAGMMGRVQLPGEMPFEQFAEGYNYSLNNPMQPLQTLADGGLADPFDRPSPKMVGGTTNVIDASGNDSRPTDEEVGALANQLQLGQELYDVNQSYNDPGRPMFGMADLFAPGGALSFAAPSPPSSSAPNMMQNAMQGIMDATRMQGPMGGTFGISPVARDGNLGIMANFTVPFEDGGPVRMQRGGTTFRTGSDGRTVISSDNIVRDDGMTDRERDSFSGGGGDPFDRPSDYQVYDDDRYTSAKIVDNSEPVADALATIAAMDAAQANFVPGQVTTRERPLSEVSGMDELLNRSQKTQQDVQNLLASMSDIDESAGDFASVSPVAATFTPVVDPQRDLLFGEPTSESLQQDALRAVEALIGSQPRNVGPVDQSVIDFINRNPQPSADSGVRASPPLPSGMPGADPLNDILAGEPGASGAGDDSLSMAVGRMLATPVTRRTASGNVTDNALADLERRMGVRKTPDQGDSGGFMGLGKLAIDALLGFGRGKAEDIFTNLEAGRPGVINARTGQVTGYVGEGPFGTKTHTGFGPSPFDANVENVEFDPNRNAYIVTPRIGPGPQEDAQSRNLPNRFAPTTDTTDTTPPPVTPPTTGLPPAMPDPMNVVVESARRNVPVTVPNILPGGMPGQGINPTFLPQSFLDLLASFKRPAPRAMQEGGAVLDQAAGNFLEALKVA